MAFHPKEMTTSTFKGLGHRLHRYTKNNQPEKWPPNQAWAQEAMAQALGFANHHAARQALSNPTDDRSRTSALANPWVIADQGRIFSNSMDSLAMAQYLKIPLQRLQGNLLLLGRDEERVRDLEELAAIASQAQLPVLIVQGAASAHMNLARSFSSYSFRAHTGYGDTVACVLEKGSSAEIIDAIVMLMDEGGENNSMWKGRAISMLSAVVLALVYLRDHQGEALGVESIRSSLRLENFLVLADQGNIPPNIRQPLQDYLAALPGYKKDAVRQSDTAMDQHGYLQMQFTRVLGATYTPLAIESRMVINLDAESRQARGLGTVMNEWTRRHSAGIIILDGLDQNSALYDWWVGASGRVRACGHGVVLGAAALSDLPAAPLRDRILDRTEHWVVMDGTPSAARDGKLLADWGAQAA